MVRSVSECVDVAVGQQVIVLDAPRMGVVAADLDEVEPVCRVDPGSRSDESLLELRVLTESAFRERVVQEC